MRIIRPLYLASIFIFVYLPIAVLILLSFNNSRFSWAWHGFTLRWYHDLMTDYHLWIAAWHSILLAIAAATIATTLSALAAIALRRKHFFGKKLLHSTVFILILAPDIVLGICLLVVFSSSEFPLGFMSLLLSHVTFCIPFAVVTIYSRLSTLEAPIFEAAIDLGANEATLFFRILLPLLAPALLASYLLCFTLSIDDVIVSYFVSGPSFEILPLKIYSMVRHGVNPEVNALCTLVIGITFVMVILSQWLLRGKQ